MNIFYGHRSILARKCRLRSAILLSLFSLITTSVYAEGEMSFKGTLIAPPPCKVDDTKTLEVNFGDRLGINKVDGTAYAQPLNYTLNCQDTGENPRGWKLRLTLDGTPASFDATVFKTTSLGSNKANEANLGIRIYQANGTTFTPNSQIDIVDATNPPKLMAVPVKKSGSTLVEGGFETLVTLQAHYQ